MKKLISVLKQNKEDNTANHKTSGIRKTVAAFLITAAILLIAAVSITVYVDPFFHYHAPLEGFPYIVDSELNQNPGMAANFTYDAVITGSSMTLNFDTNDFDGPMGLKTIKLCSSGAMPRDISNVLSIVFDETTEARQKVPVVKKCFIALDAMTYTAGTTETKYEQPEYLYDKNILNDYSYVLNKDVLLDYILRPLAKNEPTDLHTVYATTWADDFYYSRDWVMRNYTPAEERDEETPEDAYLDKTMENLKTNIIPYIENHPETEFDFFFPPYSILYWNDVIRENHLEATMQQYELIGETLLTYPNVKVFYFQDMEDVVTDLDEYMDSLHYRPEINRYMAECFADGERQVCLGGMKDKLKNMRNILSNYPFEELNAEGQ